MKHILIVEPISKRIEVNEDSTVYNALIAMNHPIGALCGGKGTCGKCKILSIDNGNNLSPLTDVEKKLLSKDELAKGTRLACQCKIKGDSRIVLLEGLISQGNKILVESDLKSLKRVYTPKLQPNVKKIHLTIPLPDLEHPLNDISRLSDALRSSYPKLKFSLDSITNNIYTLSEVIPSSLRSQKGNVTIFYWEEEGSAKILDINPGHQQELYGIAIDLGTTTIVGYLINLLSGDVVSISSMLNPQVSIGEDLITRISYIKQNNAKLKAQELIISAFNQILVKTCDKANIAPSFVKEVVVVGNTGMHHMLYGLETEQLARSPFIPVFKAPIYVDAARLGIQASSRARIYTPPVVAGFVGTDTIGCIVSSRIDTYDKFSLLIDIGTNGELVMGNKHGLTTGSCAAGSALEGAHIEFGMRAAEGAIESLKIDPDTFEPSIRTIGNGKPIGYCGSGLIDLMAEMVKSKIIKRNGNFNSKFLPDSVLDSSNGSLKYVIYNSDRDGAEFDDPRKNFMITVSQQDIRQFQLAKGAFLSGAYLLQNQFPDPPTLEQVLLAGAFGNYIDKENARIIGLFPEISPESIYQIGNAAGLGAQMCLKDTEMRDFANDIAYKVKYFEIASAKNFQKEYAFSMYFPHYKLDRFPSLEDIYHENNKKKKKKDKNK
ncbi:MAG: ASKHA domain-containing protein [Promethearchaeota archaeon]